MHKTARQIRIEGIVQGVGFRPFIYRLATERRLNGTVWNDSQGVLIEIEGPELQQESFLTAIERELPPLASISRMEVSSTAVKGRTDFRILASRNQTERTAQISPDSHVCSDCLRELFDPDDRRYRYPFINCTNCGPRYSIITDIPYDRLLTTMADFPMCPACQTEYQDPTSRRFHAQPNACASCGPQLSFAEQNGQPALVENPLEEAISRLKQGQIVAVKGLGGYHLAVDATNAAAVARLRQRKQRDEKPFALMSFNLERVGRYAQFSADEQRLLSSVERPIVLLRSREKHPLADKIAPRNRFFGVMLPYTPLHDLLLEPFLALVMTSGNRSDEPIAFADNDALERLHGIADCFLLHDRRIHIRCDDSIARLLGTEPVLYRRSRGYVPRGVKLPAEQLPVLAVGAELKNCICLTRGDRAYMSQHLGDLKNQPVVDALYQAAGHLRRLLEVEPLAFAHDLHPDYHSSHAAAALAGALPRVAVQHHHAHLASCLVDNGCAGPAIGVIFDGTGLGTDGHIWGGEFLIGDLAQFRRVGRFDYRAQPGGDAAAWEPWRMAISHLSAVCPDELPELSFMQDIDAGDIKLLQQMLAKGINSPLTSSVGRLFDAVAAMVGLRNKASYEGQAALELEMLVEPEGQLEPAYPVDIDNTDDLLLVDPAPLIRQLINDLQQQVPAAAISARFHNGLAAMIVSVCRQLTEREGRLPIALSGGVFQNRYLTERSALLLRDAGFEVLLHRQVPPNDGGVALGQAAVAAAQLKAAAANPGQ